MSEEMTEVVAEYTDRGFMPVQTNLASNVITMREADKSESAALYVAIWEKDGRLQVEEY